MYENKSVSELLQLLETDAAKGLKREEAYERKKKYGENCLKDSEKKTLWQMLLGQLEDPLILILVAAMVISAMLGEFGDAFIIVVVVTLNAAVGIIQEGKAGRAVEALKKISSPHATVIRDGERMRIDAKELVVGDLVLLEAGNLVPADLRLTESAGLYAEESALTGESVPVAKDAGYLELGQPENSVPNMVYMSAYITKGRGKGIVAASGMDTKIGHIAGMLHGKEKLTPLQERLGELGKVLSALAVGICVFLFVVAVLQKRNVGEMLLTSVSLAVAAVPEGLAAIVTIVLALSVSRMVRAKTIVRKLAAVETLGAVQVVCSDKTGTLTQNKMTVTDCCLNGRRLDSTLFGQSCQKGREEDGTLSFLRACVLCSDAVMLAEGELGDPTELALVTLAQKCGVDVPGLIAECPRVREKGFDSERKLMTTVCRLPEGGECAYTKGAAERVLEASSRCVQNGRIVPMGREEKEAAGRIQQQLMKDGKRVLGIAMNPEGSLEEKNLVFLGLAAMQDPLRPEAAEAVKAFRQAGVTTVMITGDHKDTAFAIAKELGIASRMEECITGRELEQLSETALCKRLPKLRVFARVTPEHKVRIVESFQKLGRTVAMTGDGVNDAPSLQAADIGVAMGQGGTDVARGAADFVLMDDNFATIHTAIREGRGIYENIRKSVLFLLSSNLGEIITMLVTIVAGLPAPLKASFILWINLITDSLPALALGVDDNETAELMKEPPRSKEESLFARGGLACVICYGMVIGGISLAAFLKVPYDWIQSEGLPLTLQNVIKGLGVSAVLCRAQTHAFTVLGMSQLFHAVGMRDVNRSVFRMNHRNNPYMIAAAVLGLLLQAAVTEIPFLIDLFGTVRLGVNEWLQLLALSLMPLIVHELLSIAGAGRRSTLRSLEESQQGEQEQKHAAQPGEVDA